MIDLDGIEVAGRELSKTGTYKITTKRVSGSAMTISVDKGHLPCRGWPAVGVVVARWVSIQQGLDCSSTVVR